MADNIQLNPFTIIGGSISRFVDKTTAKTQVVILDAGGSGPESIVSTVNGLPVNFVPKPRVNFYLRVNSTQTNGVVVATPGALWELSLLAIASANTSLDNTSIQVGVHPTTASSKVVFSHPGFPNAQCFIIGNGTGVIADGGTTDQLLVTTGTISTDVYDIFGCYYLK
jgi:hypothetical protein